jgi:hypothetical protein
VIHFFFGLSLVQVRGTCFCSDSSVRRVALFSGDSSVMVVYLVLFELVHNGEF